MAKVNRTFNGKRYKLLAEYSSKGEAAMQANVLRQRGFLARVVALKKRSKWFGYVTRYYLYIKG